ncbi:PRC-barrel domain-containing protein [Patescibacteria group bacterium]|nr:PRC-barrel domain-containing protein [Patescibacteria group bacterium]MBU1123945.1 PRC-barrel domain-containing protein [Patescibacteria group bacterium]MBU1911186.1 PRC-barrel domain-containing protein [Patescibacteria group bacterium]
MHLRLSTSLGLPVIEQQEEHVVGNLSDILIDPDKGKVEGLYIDVPGFAGSRALFCSNLDVIKWGTHISILDADVLAPAEERIRLEPLLKDKRTVIGQKVITESGKILGKCKDVQFDTASMRITWLFPKKFFRWRGAVPASEIIEIKEEAILVRDSDLPVEEKEAIDPVDTLEKLQDMADRGVVRPG